MGLSPAENSFARHNSGSEDLGIEVLPVSFVGAGDLDIYNPTHRIKIGDATFILARMEPRDDQFGSFIGLFEETSENLFVFKTLLSSGAPLSFAEQDPFVFQSSTELFVGFVEAGRSGDGESIWRTKIYRMDPLQLLSGNLPKEPFVITDDYIKGARICALNDTEWLVGCRITERHLGGCGLGTIALLKASLEDIPALLGSMNTLCEAKPTLVYDRYGDRHCTWGGLNQFIPLVENNGNWIAKETADTRATSYVGVLEHGAWKSPSLTVYGKDRKHYIAAKSVIDVSDLTMTLPLRVAAANHFPAGPVKILNGIPDEVQDVVYPSGLEVSINPHKCILYSGLADTVTRVSIFQNRFGHLIRELMWQRGEISDSRE